MICCYEMRKGRGSCVEPSSLKNFGSMFDAEAIHAQIPSNIEPNYQVVGKLGEYSDKLGPIVGNQDESSDRRATIRSRSGLSFIADGNLYGIFSFEKSSVVMK